LDTEEERSIDREIRQSEPWREMILKVLLDHHASLRSSQAGTVHKVDGRQRWHAIGDTSFHLCRWFMWTAGISLLPFLGATAVQSLSSEKWTGLPSIIGSGQLLPTAIALLIGGVKELSSKTDNKCARRREALIWASVFSCIPIAVVYGFLLGQIVDGTIESRLQELVTTTSQVVFTASLFIAAFAVIITAPGREIIS
jgi:uncharacterized membrane protein